MVQEGKRGITWTRGRGRVKREFKGGLRGKELKRRCYRGR